MSNHNGDDTSREGDASLDEKEAAQLTAYALGQLQGEELAAVERKLDASGSEVEQREVRDIQSLSAALSSARRSDETIPPSIALKKTIEARLDDDKSAALQPRKIALATPVKQSRRMPVFELIAVGGIALVFMALLMPASQIGRSASPLALSLDRIGDVPDDDTSLPQSRYRTDDSASTLRKSAAQDYDKQLNGSLPYPESIQFGWQAAPAEEGERRVYGGRENATASNARSTRGSRVANMELAKVPNMFGDLAGPTGDLPTVEAGKGASKGTSSDPLAPAPFGDRVGGVAISSQGQVQQQGGQAGQGQTRKYQAGETFYANDAAGRSLIELEELRQKVAMSENRAKADRQKVVDEKELFLKQNAAEGNTQRKLKDTAEEAAANATAQNDAEVEFARAALRIRTWADRTDDTGTEQYERIIENAFLSPLQQPLSTFSIDVDTASYANVRRFLTSGRLPPRNSVRIEELVNYFRYDYRQPKGKEPFSVNMEVAECPWQEKHLLLRVGLKGKDVARSERPQSNLVFLLDVSGSMSDQNKLPLLKTAMKLLVGELGENDRVSIVTYAGEAGLRLPPTRGHEQAKINRVIESLSAGGSTNGSAGINLAYEQAAAYFVPGGTNRVILCTDGDLNVGVTSDEAFTKLIKQKATSGVFLTVLGFGEGNLKDAKMEKLADNGNGLYAYIDSVREAKKVLVEQLTGSTITIAKDVKIQIEFNPAQIAAYRLLGYENRVLAAEDFNNDKKDAGEIGAGHTVTALYELVPVEVGDEAGQPRPGTDPLKYQQPGVNLLPENREGGRRGDAPGPGLVPASAAATGELLTLKLRYKEPEGETSKLLEYPLKDRGHSFNSASPDLQFAAAVASFGMILRGSEHRGSSNLAAVAEITSGALGSDAGGYRAEFVDLVRKAQALGAR